MSETRDTVLITGSGGFLGRALAGRLRRRFDVVGLDREVDAAAGIETLACDVTSDASVAEALERVRGRRIASVIHLAAFYDLSGEEDPRYEAVTVEGTARLLRALRGLDVGQFVFVSTMLVHAPCGIGERIDEDWPLKPAWPYPASKARTEAVVRGAAGGLRTVILRPAGVYDEGCHAAFLAQQIARIYERRPTGLVFAGEAEHGQPYLHLDDLRDAVERVIDRREALPPATTLLLGEERTPSYAALQARLGELIHGEPWPAHEVPKPLAEAGAWVQDEVLDQDPFIRPWMVEIADVHYALDVGRAKALLGWAPRRDLVATLPAMVAALKDDPAAFYAQNGLDAAAVAADSAQERIAAGEAPSHAPEDIDPEIYLQKRRARTYWAHLVNVALGAWLIAGPFTYGLFDPVPGATPPPAAGVDLPPPEIRNAWLGYSDIASGLLLIALSALALQRPRRWPAWAAAAVGLWLLFAPLVFWTTSAAAYALDTLIGTLVILFAVMVPATPGVGREALASSADTPAGWTYSPSTFVQRAPIVALAFVGLFVSRYLAAYQLGHIDGLWDPFFPGLEAGQNGSEAVVTSSVSKGFFIADAGFGAVAYVLDILTGAVGDRRRWRTMPWLVLLFGLLIVPLGAVSVGFIIIQPTIIGALCTLCLIQAAITVILIPYSVDEVLASCQFLWRSRRAGEPFRRTFLHGGSLPGEGRDPTPLPPLPFATVARDFVSGGVNFPWPLVACTLIGVWLLATRLTVGAEPPLAFSDHVVGCLAIVFAVTAMAEVARPVRFLNVPLGLWVAASPFVLAGAGTPALVADVAAGLALAGLSLPRGTRSDAHYGGWDRFIV